ncbi:MAG: CDGSH iron-sulfur domain-containing protein [Emcibacter sp.]|nr:CDGSH iron-sulfur domain-containing protein [Emcibacter sp.]
MTTWQNTPFVIDVKEGDKLALCMCGKSKNAPYCDGAHKDTGITPDVVTFEEDKTIYVCGCKQSANRPYCDGAHTKLS